jgi:nitrite reductase/ring-hydroxylating ferredoxin subunit/DMSO/TMAO reductase YedYZ heme-binding membrane subunit
VTHAYRAVGWNRQKRLYDLTLAAGVLFYLATFLGVGVVERPEATVETLLIRAFGTGAFLLLHIILSIGPLARLDPRFLPLLYNRRHLGVTLFLLALAHGAISLVQFHALGDLNPLVSVLVGNGRYGSLAFFPFQPLGLVALVILFLLAATSHDFWLENLTAPVWKGLHMLVYLAYGLLVAHVALGALQAERSPRLAGLLALGLAWVSGLHLVAGWREHSRDREVADRSAVAGFVRACRLADLEDGRGHTVCLGGERVAVFRYDGKISALSNACQHQNGPLGEGRVIDGLVTCPWHGFQYEPATGASPAPFTERVPTFRVRLQGAEVWIDPRPNPAGTRVEPALLPEEGR